MTAVFISSVRGEVFLGSSNGINSLVVASNEVIIISSLKYKYDAIYGQINIQGTNKTFYFNQSNVQLAPSALAGPAILSFPDGTNSLPVCISFKRLTGTSIRSSVIASTNVTQITVPSGQTCHFFGPTDNGIINSFQISDGTNSADNLLLRGGEEFAGPVTIGFKLESNPSNNANCSIVSYYFTDNFTSIPTGVVQGGTGSFMVSVEKSSNLIDWSPVILQPMSDDQKAFYRLKFSK